ncbi:MmgE/PrpD family protein [Chachezhania antarctica]|uniref:MmgE/PrpD family protein n=1 Tax=Chachezhania antarctica TaxID=2340860 RepID=UPI001968A8F8|nr:MmgE/PrpD family protein [Chachezhania antarctica]
MASRRHAESCQAVPACHFTHACADAAVALATTHGVTAEDIVEVQALVPAGVHKTVCEPIGTKRCPQNSYDAQFSVPWAIASGLARKRFGLTELSDEALNDPELLALAAKVTCADYPDAPFPKYYSGEVVLTLGDGRTLTHGEEINRGNPDRPLTNDEIVAKYWENATTAVSDNRAEAIRDAVLGLDAQPDARAFAAVLAGVPV